MERDLAGLGEDLITTAARLVRWAPKPSPSGQSLSAVRILARIGDQGPTRISDLAAAENCSQPTITNHVKRLESAGLVERAADPRDARAWMIALTDAGRAQLDELRHALGTGVEPYLAQLSRRDRKALREGVDAMHRLMALEA